MDFDHEYVAAAVVVAVLNKKRKRLRQKRERSVWVKPWLSIRNELDADRTLLPEFRVEDDEEYNKFLRMSPENLRELLRLVQFDIQKQETLYVKQYPQALSWLQRFGYYLPVIPVVVERRNDIPQLKSELIRNNNI